MNTILVTGGAGFIGSNFLTRQIKTGNTRIINYDKLTYAGNLDTLSSIENNSNYLFVKGDICDQKLVNKILVENKVDSIINFAAESHVDRSIESPDDFIQTNIVGTFKLLQASRDYLNSIKGAKDKKDRYKKFRFLHVSTDEVYGSLGDRGAFTEETPYAPNSPYAASKASSDHLIRSYYQTFSFPAITTNCSNNYGPHQFPEKLIPLMIQKARLGESLPIYGDGLHVRDWLYVDDHCTALEKVLESGKLGQVYNIGGNNEKTNLDLVTILCGALDELIPDSPHKPHKSLIKFVDDRPGHDRRYAIDAGKIKKELGWEPSESLDTGLKKTIQWYLNNPQWIERVMSGAYKGQRLGLKNMTERKND
jgi:dTDP-glucose 4,6-dehydratase